jgi:hypothetical protein
MALDPCSPHLILSLDIKSISLTDGGKSSSLPITNTMPGTVNTKENLVNQVHTPGKFNIPITLKPPKRRMDMLFCCGSLGIGNETEKKS